MYERAGLQYSVFNSKGAMGQSKMLDETSLRTRLALEPCIDPPSELQPHIDNAIDEALHGCSRHFI